jgi:hypothetical protein
MSETLTATNPATTEAPQTFGIAAEFPSAAALYHAAEKCRDQGFKKWDVHSPFPIHGMDEAMGLGNSKVSLIALVAACTGTVLAVMLEFIPSLWLYPLIVHGKPLTFFTVPAFFPVIFEFTVLCCAFGCLFGMLALNRLPRWNHPLFNWERFSKFSDDGFFLSIEADDPKFQENRTREFLEGIGAKNITLIHE